MGVFVKHQFCENYFDKIWQVKSVEKGDLLILSFPQKFKFFESKKNYCFTKQKCALYLLFCFGFCKTKRVGENLFFD
jgi:hypothetical protein